MTDATGKTMGVDNPFVIEAARIKELEAKATPGPLRIGGVSIETGSISVGSEALRIVVADFTNAASFGDFIREAFANRTFGTPNAATTQWANAELYIHLRNRAPVIAEVFELLAEVEGAMGGTANIFESYAREHRNKADIARQLCDEAKALASENKARTNDAAASTLRATLSRLAELKGRVGK